MTKAYATLLEVLNPELFPPVVSKAAAEVTCEHDCPVTYVKTYCSSGGKQTLLHTFQGDELQLFPANTLRVADSGAIQETARRLALVYLNH